MRIPSAPFVTETKAWVALALKRMIRYAAENGFDRVAWTTGEQQAARYDLSKQIDALTYKKNADGTYEVKAYVKNGEGRMMDSHDMGTAIAAGDLEDHVGKEIAKKMIDDVGEKSRLEGWRTLRDTDLKVGGEGMKAFYDKIIPQVANEVLKKFGGGRVGEVRITVPETKVVFADRGKDRSESIHPRQPGFDITPALKGEAMAGLPLFSKAATESITDITRKMADGDLQREQVNAHLAGQLDRPDMRDLTERLLGNAGVEMKALATALRRGYHEYIASGLSRARASLGYANVFGVMTHFIQRKALIFERAIAKDLSTWVKGASKADKVAAFKAMMTATVGSYAHDSAEYQALMQPLTQDQRAMIDQAWTMIGKMLDAEFVAEQAKYRKLFTDDAQYNEWFENRKVQVEQLKRNSYVPERRYGDYFVHAYVKAPDGKPITVYYEQYEREAGRRPCESRA